MFEFIYYGRSFPRDCVHWAVINSCTNFARLLRSDTCRSGTFIYKIYSCSVNSLCIRESVPSPFAPINIERQLWSARWLNAHENERNKSEFDLDKSAFRSLSILSLFEAALRIDAIGRLLIKSINSQRSLRAVYRFPRFCFAIKVCCFTAKEWREVFFLACVCWALLCLFLALERQHNNFQINMWIFFRSLSLSLTRFDDEKKVFCSSRCSFPSFLV